MGGASAAVENWPLGNYHLAADVLPLWISIRPLGRRDVYAIDKRRPRTDDPHAQALGNASHKVLKRNFKVRRVILVLQRLILKPTSGRE